MSFESKIKEQFEHFKIKLPECSKYKKQYYADYIELISLVSDDFVSRADIRDRLQDEGKRAKTDSPNDGEIGSMESQRNDKEEGIVNNYFDYIEVRSTVYKTNYPFYIDKEKGIKCIEKESLSEHQKLYIYMLIASSLNTFTKLDTYIADDFEKISELALKAYLPSSAKVYGFGSNSAYTGNAKNKIRTLAKDMNIYRIDDRLIDQIPNQNTKEKGLDIIGWLPFEDENPNTLIVLGQSACGKDWFGKQLETSRYDRFYQYYMTPFIHAMFYPEDFENRDGLFQLDADLIGNLVFERRRLINLINHDIFKHLLYGNQIINRFVEYREDLV